ncbi:unnamed protein product [Amaranthus hypochondriacus]
MTTKTHRKRKRVSKIGKMEEGNHELANSIRKRIEELPPLSSKCCIYKVPRTLRNVNINAYKPCLISIGPLHYGIKSLQSMQEQKLRLVAHSKAPWNRWKATLNHHYFNNPWASISVVAAVFLLILTVVQTACCIIATKRLMYSDRL